MTIESYHNTGKSHVPSWLARKAGVTFGFGGKIVSFGRDNTTVAPAATAASPQAAAAAAAAAAKKGSVAAFKDAACIQNKAPKLFIDSMSADAAVLALSNVFQSYLASGDWAGLVRARLAAAEAAGDKTEAQQWRVMALLGHGIEGLTPALLAELGYGPDSGNALPSLADALSNNNSNISVPDNGGATESVSSAAPAAAAAAGGSDFDLDSLLGGAASAEDLFGGLSLSPQVRFSYIRRKMTMI